MTDRSAEHRNSPSTTDWSARPNVVGEVGIQWNTFLQLPCAYGQYDVLQQIGAGGMGAVYRARNRRLQREVALKLLPRLQAEDTYSVARFERETALLGNLDHPHIVRAYDAGEVNDVPYLAMELVDGLDLAALVQRLGKVPVAEAAELIRQAAAGLQYAHERGLVHRDIKPSNLLLSWDGVVKVADLGLACFSRQKSPAGMAAGPALTVTGQFAGTVDYMAPEQAADVRNVDTRADVYSLGCTLFKLLVGAPPFAAPTYSSITSKIVAHATVPAPDVREFDPTIPAVLANIVRRMLSKQPDDRPRDPGEVVAALSPLATDADLAKLLARAKETAGQAVPPSTLQSKQQTTRAGKRSFSAWSGRSATTWIGGAVLCAAAALILVGTIRPWNKSADHTMLDEPATSATPMQLLPTEKEPSNTPPSLATVPIAALEPPAALPAPTERTFKPLLWHNLLDRPPHELWWYRDAGVATWHFDSQQEQLLVSCNDVGLLQLGTIDAPNYRLQISIRQNNWSGGAGSFWGFHHTFIDGKSAPRYQCLILRPFLPDNAEKAFSLQRTLCTILELKPGTHFVQQEALAAAPLPRPTSPEICLDITMTRGMLTKVIWEGVELPTLIKSQVLAKTTPEDYCGAFGTLNMTGDCVFRNARLMVYDEPATE